MCILNDIVHFWTTLKSKLNILSHIGDSLAIMKYINAVALNILKNQWMFRIKALSNIHEAAVRGYIFLNGKKT